MLLTSIGGSILCHSATACALSAGTKRSLIESQQLGRSDLVDSSIQHTSTCC